MSEYCSGCRKKIRFYHKLGCNSSWHLQCWNSWNDGYNCAYYHADTMNKRFKLPTLDEIYWATQIVYNEGLYNKVIEKIKNSYETYCIKEFKKEL